MNSNVAFDLLVMKTYSSLTHFALHANENGKFANDKNENALSLEASKLQTNNERYDFQD
jgi:hypothetical protein